MGRGKRTNNPLAELLLARLDRIEVALAQLCGAPPDSAHGPGPSSSSATSSPWPSPPTASTLRAEASECVHCFGLAYADELFNTDSETSVSNLENGCVSLDIDTGCNDESQRNPVFNQLHECASQDIGTGCGKGPQGNLVIDRISEYVPQASGTGGNDEPPRNGVFNPLNECIPLDIGSGCYEEPQSNQDLNVWGDCAPLVWGDCAPLDIRSVGKEGPQGNPASNLTNECIPQDLGIGCNDEACFTLGHLLQDLTSDFAICHGYDASQAYFATACPHHRALLDPGSIHLHPSWDCFVAACSSGFVRYAQTFRNFCIFLDILDYTEFYDLETASDGSPIPGDAADKVATEAVGDHRLTSEQAGEFSDLLDEQVKLGFRVL